MKERRIVIAEDSHTQAVRLQFLLEENGYAVSHGKNGKEALELTIEEKPDLVISDIVMPEMDGFQLTREIRANDEISATPILLLTSLSGLADILKGMECGADNYIVKPFEEEDIISRIDHALQKGTRVSEVKDDAIVFTFNNDQYKIDSGSERLVDYLITTFETALKKKNELEVARRDLINANETLEQKVEQRTRKLFEEVTQRKQYQIELEKALEKANESDRLKSVFLANMSHEIRTPMNAILGFSQLLAENDLTKDDREKYISLINQNGDSLLLLINDIIDISRIEAGEVEVVKEDFEISRIFDEMLFSFTSTKNQLNKEHIEICLDPECTENNRTIYSDRLRIKQVLMNFIGNAIKCTDEGSIELGCNLVSENTLQFTVKDTGIGIAKENQEIIFERFKQLDERSTRTMRGTGLGLFIAKRIVEILGGEIGVESELGKGSLFYFTVPLEARPDEATKQPAEQSADKISDVQWGDKKFLIAEDEKSNADLIKIFLNKTGAELLFAENGVEAVSLFEKNGDIDMVLSDIRMPEMDGIEALKRIKKIDDKIPVLALSAYGLSEEYREQIETLFDGFLLKPIKLPSLIHLIKETLLNYS